MNIKTHKLQCIIEIINYYQHIIWHIIKNKELFIYNTLWEQERRIHH